MSQTLGLSGGGHSTSFQVGPEDPNLWVLLCSQRNRKVGSTTLALTFGANTSAAASWVRFWEGSSRSMFRGGMFILFANVDSCSFRYPRWVFYIK